MDLWNPTVNMTAAVSSGIVGYSIVGGICGPARYSLVEEEGFNNMHNAAHELGHR